MTNRSEAFGRLLKAGIASIVNCEGKKAAIVEDELGLLIGVSGDSIQRYKSGYLPPEDRTVEILATAAVQRGYLGREWLQRFLHAARYPFADTLLDKLCPIGPARPRPPRVYHNLPAPTYSQFVMREQAFAEVIDGLQQRSAAVLVVGLGGNGKTSLARHERRPLQQVVDDLYAARGELFDDLFTRAWALLDEAARRVLLVMTFFPTSASCMEQSIRAAQSRMLIIGS